MSLETFLNIPFDILVPGFSKLPHPRIIYLTSFSGAVLSAYGVELLHKKNVPADFLKRALILFWAFWILYTSLILIEYRKNLPSHWISPLNPVLHIPILILVTSSLLIYLRKRMGNNLFAIFSLLLISSDLIPLGFNFNTCADRKYADVKDSYIQKIIGEERELFRITGVDPNWNILLKKFTPEGYQSLYPNFYFRAISENSPYVTHQLKVLHSMLSKTMIKLLNVKYIYKSPWSDAKVEEGATLIHSKLAKIYRVNDYLPRAFFITNVQKRNENWIISALRNNAFDPKEILYLSEDFPEVFPINAENRVEILHYSPHKVSISVYNNADGFLVLSDSYYPGWKCYVDGKEEKIYKAYTFLRAVFLKKGTHKVEFLYEPSLYKIGKGITLAGVIISILLMGAFYPKPEKKPETQPIKDDEKTDFISISILSVFLITILLLTARWMKLTSEVAKSKWHAEIAYIFKKGGEREMALRYLKKAVSFKKTSYQAHEGLGLIYNSEKKYPEALEQFEKAVKIIPNPRGFINSAVLKTKLKKYTSAISDLEKALELNPNSHDAYFRLSVVYELMGEHTKAEKYKRIAEELKEVSQ